MAVKIDVVKLLANEKAVVSMAEGRRVIAQGAVYTDDLKITNSTTEVNIGDRIHVGKRSGSRLSILLTDEIIEKCLVPKLKSE